MILLDANILLELLLPGRTHQKAVISFLEKTTEPVCISMLTVHLVLYFGAKLGLSHQDLHKFLNSHIVQDLTADDYAHSMKFIHGHDYEDAMQLAVAKRCNCTYIITLDKKFAQRYEQDFSFKLLGE